MKKQAIFALAFILGQAPSICGMEQKQPSTQPIEKSASMVSLEQALENYQKQQEEEQDLQFIEARQQEKIRKQGSPVGYSQEQLQKELDKARTQYEKEAQQLKETARQIERLREMRDKALKRDSSSPTI